MKKVKLGEICEVQAGGTPSRNKKEFWVQGNIPWVKIKDINSKYISKVEEHITELGLQFSSAKLFSRGTILYTIFATIGEVAILDIDAATNQAIAGLHLKSEKVLKEYLYFFLLSIRNRVKNDSRGVAQNNINLTYLKNIEVPIVENSIQQEICNNLTKINQIITLRNQQLIELSNLVKSRFNEMFGDPLNNDKMFAVKTGQQCFKFSSGKLLDKNDRVFEGYPAYGGNGIAWKSRNYLIDNPTIIIGRVGAYCGNVRTSHGKAWISDNAIYIKEFKNLDFNLVFLLELMKVIDFSRFADFSGQPKITQKPLEKQKYIVPPLDLQNDFADFVAQVDKSQFACQIVIKLWRNSLKSSII